ncbi:MAG: nickel-dependent lactate racemase [Armatimonadota bacterium]|nr:nickel-dependent lactate racemase [Armatimonadota bacterium]
MRVDFPYPDVSPLEIPEGNLLGVFHAPEHPPADDVAACVSRALDNPIGSPSLAELARGRKDALLITDDYTRQTPVKEIIPAVVKRLAAGGLNPSSIKILVALGTHRSMTEGEKLAKFGEDICRNFEIVNHDWRDEKSLVEIGVTPGDAKLRINPVAANADLIIGIGQITPHRIAGFSGGAKIILPGICGASATAHTHWIGGTLPGDKVLGFVDNPVRDEMNEAARLARLVFIVNAICNTNGQTIEIVAGNVVTAHRRGAEIAREVLGVKIPRQADIVIVDSFPKDIEMWQAAKALYAADVAVRPGGALILVSPCYEGVSKSHPLILERGYKTEKETLAEVESGRLTNLMVASHCLRVGRLIKDKAAGILVSSGIPKADAEHLGFIHADNPSQALEKAFSIVGPNASVAVLQHGSELLPVVG